MSDAIDVEELEGFEDIPELCNWFVSEGGKREGRTNQRELNVDVHSVNRLDRAVLIVW
jgi:hypothetical protein